MHRRYSLLALSLLSLLSPLTREASAKAPDPQAKAEVTATSVVEAQLVVPLREKEVRRSRFSRAYYPPSSRRIRMLDREPSTDRLGAAFLTFAIDELAGKFRNADDSHSHWRKDAIVGCVYPGSDEVFVKRGDAFFAVGLLLGKKTAVAPEVTCRPTPSAPTVAAGS